MRYPNKLLDRWVKKVCFGIFLVFCFVLLAAGWVYYDVYIAPQRSAAMFCDLWKRRLQSIGNPDKIPNEWNNTVYLRRFEDGWILAAMYHGSCTQTSGAHAFNASVFRDSAGHVVVYSDYSPCADGIESMGEFWERLAPAATLREYNSRFRDGPPKTG